MSPTAAFLREHLTGRNVIAGVVVGAYLVPQAMAYGELAGVGASAGLAVAIIPLIVYPLIGRSKWLSLGPESAVALMAGATVAPIAASNDIPVATLLGLVSVLTGLILLAARLARVSFVTDLLSKPVLIGYLTGVAGVMFLSQVDRVLGAPVDTDTIPALVGDLLSGVAVNGWAVLIGVGTLAIILGFQRWVPRVPGTLVALAVGVVAGYTLPVETIGDFSLQLPQLEFTWIPWDTVGDGPGRGGDRDRRVHRRHRHGPSVRRQRAGRCRPRAHGARRRGRHRRPVRRLPRVRVVLPHGHRSDERGDQPLLLVGRRGRPHHHRADAVERAGAPAAGHAGRDHPVRRLDADRPGRMDVASPAALGRGRRRRHVCARRRPPRYPARIGIAVALSVAELLIRLSRPHEGILGFVPDLAGMHDIDDYPDAEQIPGLVVYRYDSPLFFANSNDFFSQCLEASDTPGCRWFVLNMEANVEVDTTGLDALVELHDELKKRDIVLKLARVKNDLMIPMQRYGVAEVIGEENMYATLPTAVAAFREWAERHPTPGRGIRRPGAVEAAPVRAQRQPAPAAAEAPRVGLVGGVSGTAGRAYTAE